MCVVGAPGGSSGPPCGALPAITSVSILRASSTAEKEPEMVILRGCRSNFF